jgi:hypothetical protein
MRKLLLMVSNTCMKRTVAEISGAVDSIDIDPNILWRFYPKPRAKLNKQSVLDIKETNERRAVVTNRD